MTKIKDILRQDRANFYKLALCRKNSKVGHEMSGYIIKTFDLKKCLLYSIVLIFLGAPSYLNAQKSVEDSSISYALMQSICKDRGEDGSRKCLCSKLDDSYKDSSEMFSFEEFFYGSFTDSNAEEMLVITSGCEAHANNWGGSMLLRKTGTAWKKIFYRAGHPGKCKKIHSMNNQSELLCHDEYMNQGYGSDRLVHYRITEDGFEVLNILYHGESDEGALDSTQKNTQIKNWKLDDIDQDGYLDVVININQNGKEIKKITYLYRKGMFVQNIYPFFRQ